jgi:HAD superfamily hydrolase (TIGR01509 family)
MRVRAIIFDFDGLILDTESTELQGWQEVYPEHGCELRLDTWASCIGRPSGFFDPYVHLERLTGQPVERAALRARRRERCRVLNLAQPVRPGVEQWITEAADRGIKLGVASSSDRAWVRGHLDRLGLLARFACVTCYEDTRVHKPDPAPYLDCLASLGAVASEAVAVEDSPNGVAAAKGAGLFCVAVPNPVTRQLDLSRADMRVDSLADLPLETLLQQLDRQR